jgi:hypothetical protein
LSDDRTEAAARKAKRLQGQKLDGDQAMREYRQSQIATRDKTEKLKALRLARDAEQARLAAEKAANPARRKRKTAP